MDGRSANLLTLRWWDRTRTSGCKVPRGPSILWLCGIHATAGRCLTERTGTQQLETNKTTVKFTKEGFQTTKRVSVSCSGARTLLKSCVFPIIPVHSLFAFSFTANLQTGQAEVSNGVKEYLRTTAELKQSFGFIWRIPGDVCHRQRGWQSRLPWLIKMLSVSMPSSESSRDAFSSHDSWGHVQRISLDSKRCWSWAPRSPKLTLGQVEELLNVYIYININIRKVLLQCLSIYQVTMFTYTLLIHEISQNLIS